MAACIREECPQGVIGVAGGLVILREPLSLGLVAGIILTLAGVGIVIWRGNRRAEKATQTDPETAAPLP